MFAFRKQNRIALGDFLAARLVLRAGVMIGGPTLRVDLIRAEPFLAQEAIHHRITERAGMAARFPNLWMHDDRRFQPNHVIAILRHAAPPIILDVALELRTERTVIPKAIDPAVNFGRLEDQSAALAEGDNLLHAIIHFGFRHKYRLTSFR